VISRLTTRGGSVSTQRGLTPAVAKPSSLSAKFKSHQMSKSSMSWRGIPQERPKSPERTDESGEFSVADEFETIENKIQVEEVDELTNRKEIK